MVLWALDSADLLSASSSNVGGVPYSASQPIQQAKTKQDTRGIFWRYRPCRVMAGPPQRCWAGPGRGCRAREPNLGPRISRSPRHPVPRLGDVGVDPRRDRPSHDGQGFDRRQVATRRA